MDAFMIPVVFVSVQPLDHCKSYPSSYFVPEYLYCSLWPLCRPRLASLPEPNSDGDGDGDGCYGMVVMRSSHIGGYPQQSLF